MSRSEFKNKLKENACSHFNWAKNSFKIDIEGNLLQLDESKQEETWNNVDTGRFGEKQYKSIIKAAESGCMII